MFNLRKQCKYYIEIAGIIGYNCKGTFFLFPVVLLMCCGAIYSHDSR